MGLQSCPELVKHGLAYDTVSGFVFEKQHDVSVVIVSEQKDPIQAGLCGGDDCSTGFLDLKCGF